MDHSPAPWRAFETVEPGTPDGSGDTGPREAGPRTATAGTADGTQPVPRSVLIGAIVAITLLGAGAVAMASGGSAPDIVVGSEASSDAGTAGAGASLVVDVGGAVVNPGVYHLPPGSRVGDAIAAAGGYGPRVDAERTSTSLNLASPVEDGERIQVPSRDDRPGANEPSDGPPGAAGSETTGSAPVDLNRASQAELEALPGIGPVTAGKIIASRETTPFAAVQDLRDRKLVGQKTFDALKDLVSVR